MPDWPLAMNWMRRSLNSLAESCPIPRKACTEAATSTRRAMSRPGRTGIVMCGTLRPRISKVSTSRPERSSSMPGCQSTKVTTRSTRFATHRTDAEDRSDVDDADATALHVTAVQVLGGALQFAVADERHDDVVVGDERVAALDQRQGAFALADAGGAAEQHADALDVDERGVEVRTGGELLLEEHRGLGREVLGLELGADQRDAMAVRDAQEQVVDRQAARDDDRGDLLEEDVVEEPRNGSVWSER